MKSIRKVTTLILLIALFSCEEDRYLPQSIVPSEIRPYYDSFYKEAELRGIYLEEKPVEIIIVKGLKYKGDYVSGLSNRSKKTIHISYKSVDYKNERNAINLDFLIFHEMGHYVLGRHHDDCVNEDNSPCSIMHGSKFAYTVGKEHLRSYYLDELFGILE